MHDEQLAARESFGESLQSVLETMVFMFADEVGAEDLEANVERAVRARMKFTGHSESQVYGSVWIAADYDLCAEIACNMLGSDPGSLSEDNVRDALGEILNMSCGQFLTSLFGEDRVFDLTVPESGKLDEEQWKSLAGEDGCLFLEVEDGWMLANVEMEDES